MAEGTVHLRVALEAEREVRGWKFIAGVTTGDLTCLHHAPSPENAVTAPLQPRRQPHCHTQASREPLDPERGSEYVYGW